MWSLRLSSAMLSTAAISLGTPAWADTVTPGEVTSWGHPFCEDYSFVRGLAYDGQRYYVADTADHCIDGRPRDNTGRIYIYDRQGTLIKRIPEEPPVRESFFPQGVATDGTRLWTSDYWGQQIYEYDIATGQLLRQFGSPVASPVSLDFQASTQTLWLTGYGDPQVYQVRLDGSVRSKFPTSGLGPLINPAVDGRGDLWLAGVRGNTPKFRRVSSTGTVLQNYTEPGWTSIATNIHDRAAGYVKDLKQIYNPATDRWEVHFQPFTVKTLGGRSDRLGDQAVQCDNLRTGQSTAAHFGGPEHWNCEDGGLAVRRGDPVRVTISGTAP